jgi:hypothetical protein
MIQTLHKMTTLTWGQRKYCDMNSTRKILEFLDTSLLPCGNARYGSSDSICYYMALCVRVSALIALKI